MYEVKPRAVEDKNDKQTMKDEVKMHSQLKTEQQPKC